MKHRVMFSIILLSLGLILGSCKKDSDAVAVQTSASAQDVLKVGTTWIYENKIFDSTGLVVKTYYDTTAISRDTVINNQQWFITSSIHHGNELYVVLGIGLKNGEYWKMIRGRTSFYDTVVTSPIFKLNMTKDASFESMYCLLTSLTPVIYKRTVVNISVSITAAGNSLDCIYLKETKLSPDHYYNFEYQNYYYNAAYGLVKNEWFMKTGGGTVYRQSTTTLHEIKIPQ